ncbi:hypothetical protein [Streptomyces sp. 8N706]|uniref:hypothetical protein n=1 Tax=Streptomyces sp. 8N706 TaxID=3457416 RepID=UPI003FD46147
MYDVLADLKNLYKEREIELGELYVESMTTALNHQLSYQVPAMYGITRTLFDSPRMIAWNLVQNGIDEAKGAARIQIIAEKYADPELAKKMHRHVGEELKHSRLFLNMVQLTGYQTVEVDLADGEEQVGMVMDFDDELRAFICRVHSIEIRSWTVLRYYLDALREMSRQDIAEKMIPVIEHIMVDEINHVVYTGEAIDGWLREDPSLKETLDGCFAHTNRETWQDIAGMAKYLADNYSFALDPE